MADSTDDAPAGGIPRPSIPVGDEAPPQGLPRPKIDANLERMKDLTAMGRPSLPVGRRMHHHKGQYGARPTIRFNLPKKKSAPYDWEQEGL